MLSAHMQPMRRRETSNQPAADAANWPTPYMYGALLTGTMYNQQGEYWQRCTCWVVSDGECAVRLPAARVVPQFSSRNRTCGASGMSGNSLSSMMCCWSR